MLVTCEKRVTIIAEITLGINSQYGPWLMTICIIWPNSGGTLTFESTPDDLEWMLEKLFGDGKDVRDGDCLHVPIICIDYIRVLGCHL